MIIIFFKKRGTCWIWLVTEEFVGQPASPGIIQSFAYRRFSKGVDGAKCGGRLYRMREIARASIVYTVHSISSVTEKV